MKPDTIRACSIWRALAVVGDVPVLLIMEQAFLGRQRFEDFVRATGIARSVVSNRLARLVAEGVLTKQAGKPAGYRLTDKGLDLFPFGLMIQRWQTLWEVGERDYGVRLVHRTCCTQTQPAPQCDSCRGEIDAREVSWTAGPGLSQVTPSYARRRKQTTAAANRRANGSMVDSVIELFGDRWATLVVRACFTGIHRFDEIQQDTLMASNILSDRLERLQAQGIIRADPYSGHQGRFNYRLTRKGRDLYPVLLALLEWGDQWYADAKGPPVLLTHETCGNPLKMSLVCDHCSGVVTARNLSFEQLVQTELPGDERQRI